ncbi:hypothetical protein KI387_007388, partial [Taxus chinensis]
FHLVHGMKNIDIEYTSVHEEYLEVGVEFLITTSYQTYIRTFSLGMCGILGIITSE